MSEPFPKFVRDLEGIAVRTKSVMRNGHMEIPAGTVGVISSATGWERITFKGDQCACCGCRPFISKVSIDQLERCPPQTRVEEKT